MPTIYITGGATLNYHGRGLLPATSVSLRFARP